MSVLINMEMPKNGSCIQIVIDDDGKVYPSVEKCILKMGSIANAVPVPPHGDLIDRDALMKSESPIKKMMMFGGQYVFAEDEIKNAPAVIPAEEGE